MVINVGSLVVRGIYKDAGLVNGVKGAGKHMKTMTQRIKSTITDTKRMTKATHALKGALGLMGLGGALAFGKLLMSSPYLAGALTKIKTYVELLAWAMSKHLKPILDLVADAVKWLYDKFTSLSPAMQKAVTWATTFGATLLGGLGIKAIIGKLGTLMGFTGFAGVTAAISGTIGKMTAFMASGSLLSFVSAGAIGVGLGLLAIKLIDIAGGFEKIESWGAAAAEKLGDFKWGIMDVLSPLSTLSAGMVGLVRGGVPGAKERMAESKKRSQHAKFMASGGAKGERYMRTHIPTPNPSLSPSTTTSGSENVNSPSYTQEYTNPYGGIPEKTIIEKGDYNVNLDFSNSSFITKEDLEELARKVEKIITENAINQGYY